MKLIEWGMKGRRIWGRPLRDLIKMEDTCCFFSSLVKIGQCRASRRGFESHQSLVLMCFSLTKFGWESTRRVALGVRLLNLYRVFLGGRVCGVPRCQIFKDKIAAAPI